KAYSLVLILIGLLFFCTDLFGYESCGIRIKTCVAFYFAR
ncbi:MAG: hypothetical protein ACI9XJ_002549, partial [Marivirga sp.]